ncbi:IS66 family insertion sequence element accessory protein TnpB [Pseudomonas sp. SDO524_S393]
MLERVLSRPVSVFQSCTAHSHKDELASGKSCHLHELSSRAVAMIRIGITWLTTEPMDMHAGTGAVSARVISVFGAAQPHYAYLFANCRANRMKDLVRNGLGIGLAARRLHLGKLAWSGMPHGSQMELST